MPRIRAPMWVTLIGPCRCGARPGGRVMTAMVGRYGVSRPIGPEPLEQLKRQRSRMVQVLLWLLLVVVLGALTLNAVLLGRDILTLNGLVPNLTFIVMLL